MSLQLNHMVVVLAAEKIKLLRHQDKGGGGKERRLICNEGGGTVHDFIARNDPMHYLQTSRCNAMQISKEWAAALKFVSGWQRQYETDRTLHLLKTTKSISRNSGKVYRHLHAGNIVQCALPMTSSLQLQASD